MYTSTFTQKRKILINTTSRELQERHQECNRPVPGLDSDWGDDPRDRERLTRFEYSYKVLGVYG